MILGHGHAEVLEAVFEQLPSGTTFFATNALGIELAEETCRAVPCADQLRYVSTGGEADMYAMRLARAFTWRADIMAHFDKAFVGKERWLMQLFTLSGNPIAAAVGLKTLEILRREGQYDRLRNIGVQVQELIQSALDRTGQDFQLVGDETLFDVLCAKSPVRDYRDTKSADTPLNERFNAALRREGIFKTPGKTYPCLALTDDDLARTGIAYRAAANMLL